ncbi:MAG TPA: hypothetical protein VFD32_02645 [Dehalococcoidia bacterium]|nr:hypothetical protein [Dehalococcoidia bacterium]
MTTEANPVNAPKDRSALFNDSARIQAALDEAVRAAILDHKRAGNPIAIWRDGQVVWLAPDEIPDDDEPGE